MCYIQVKIIDYSFWYQILSLCCLLNAWLSAVVLNIFVTFFHSFFLFILFFNFIFKSVPLLINLYSFSLSKLQSLFAKSSLFSISLWQSEFSTKNKISSVALSALLAPIMFRNLQDNFWLFSASTMFPVKNAGACMVFLSAKHSERMNIKLKIVFYFVLLLSLEVSV